MKALLNTSQHHTWDSQNMTASYIRLIKAKPTRLHTPLSNRRQTDILSQEPRKLSVLGQVDLRVRGIFCLFYTSLEQSNLNLKYNLTITLSLQEGKQNGRKARRFYMTVNSMSLFVFADRGCSDWPGTGCPCQSLRVELKKVHGKQNLTFSHLFTQPKFFCLGHCHQHYYLGGTHFGTSKL